MTVPQRSNASHSLPEDEEIEGLSETRVTEAVSKYQVTEATSKNGLHISASNSTRGYTMADDERNRERLLRLAASLASTPADERVMTDIATYGIEQAVDRWREGLGPTSVCDRIQVALQKADKLLLTMPDTWRYVIPGDDEWPSQCEDLDLSAPIGLWCRGSLSLDTVGDRMVSIVGARAATAYGERVAIELASACAQHNIAVVSGAAYGIDAAAHRGALAASGPTVAVLACGIDVSYPAAHAGLLERVAESGLLMSESPPGTKPHKHLFLIRNRLIAALSSHTVVVEAALRSGSLSTSNWASDLGRTVWGIPGQISSAASAGVHEAIRRGVMNIAPSIDSIVAQYGGAPNELSENERLVIELCRGRELTLEHLIAGLDTRMSSHEVVGVVTLLELRGYLIRCDHGWTAKPTGT